MWRSGYLMCPACKKVYYANHIMPVSEFGKMEYYCPDIDCNPHFPLFTIDELMVEPVRVLNELGYDTDYCCSGHPRRNDIERGYIAFKTTYHFDTIPDGWALEDDSGGRTVIRATGPDVFENMKNLTKWVKELDDF